MFYWLKYVNAIGIVLAQMWIACSPDIRDRLCYGGALAVVGMTNSFLISLAARINFLAGFQGIDARINKGLIGKQAKLLLPYFFAILVIMALPWLEARWGMLLMVLLSGVWTITLGVHIATSYEVNVVDQVSEPATKKL